MNNKELAKEIIEQVQCGASESDVLQLLDDNTSHDKALDIDLVSGCFPNDKEIELHSNVHSDDNDFRPNTYSSYKEGMEDCIELIKQKLNNR